MYLIIVMADHLHSVVNRIDFNCVCVCVCVYVCVCEIQFNSLHTEKAANLYFIFYHLHIGVHVRTFNFYT